MTLEQNKNFQLGESGESRLQANSDKRKVSRCEGGWEPRSRGWIPGSRGWGEQRAAGGGGCPGCLTWMTRGSSFPLGVIFSRTRGAARYCFSPRITLVGIPSSRMKSASNRERFWGEEERARG